MKKTFDISELWVVGYWNTGVDYSAPIIVEPVFATKSKFRGRFLFLFPPFSIDGDSITSEQIGGQEEFVQLNDGDDIRMFASPIPVRSNGVLIAVYERNVCYVDMKDYNIAHQITDVMRITEIAKRDIVFYLTLGRFDKAFGVAITASPYDKCDAGLKAAAYVALFCERRISLVEFFVAFVNDYAIEKEVKKYARMVPADFLSWAREDFWLFTYPESERGGKSCQKDES